MTGGTTVELRFKNQAMFQFVALLEKTRERAIYMKRQAAQEDEGLRMLASQSVRTMCNLTISFFPFQRHTRHLRSQAQSL